MKSLWTATPVRPLSRPALRHPWLCGGRLARPARPAPHLLLLSGKLTLCPGTTVAALDGFVHAFFDPSGALPSGAPACRPTHQNVDANFLAFVWTSLVAQPGMRVAVVEPVVAGAGANSTPAAAPAKGKKKAKAVAAAPAQTHYLRALVEPESALGRPKLVATYSDKLRIVAAKEASWVAMTRSHERVSRCSRSRPRRMDS